jgi:hypothetical protein
MIRNGRTALVLGLALAASAALAQPNTNASDPVNNAGSGSSPPGMPVQSK